MKPLPAWTDTSTAGRPQSRRSGPRLEVEAVLNGRLAKGNLRMVVHDLGFGGLLSCVFGVLYVLISLDDHALVAGALSLFAAFAVVMI